jgi:hypothetical protein
MHPHISPEYVGFYLTASAWSLRFQNSHPIVNILSSSAKHFRGDADLFDTLNHSRTILSVLVHICAFASVVIACAYTFRALALVPFPLGAVVGAVFYLVLLLIIWD